MAGARSFLRRRRDGSDLWTLRVVVCAQKLPRGRCARGKWLLSLHGLGCAEAARPRDWSSGDREGSLAAQKTGRGNRAHFGRATRTARAPAAEQLENYQSN